MMNTLNTLTKILNSKNLQEYKENFNLLISTLHKEEISEMLIEDKINISNGIREVAKKAFILTNDKDTLCLFEDFLLVSIRHLQKNEPEDSYLFDDFLLRLYLENIVTNQRFLADYLVELCKEKKYKKIGNILQNFDLSSLNTVRKSLSLDNSMTFGYIHLDKKERLNFIATMINTTIPSNKHESYMYVLMKMTHKKDIVSVIDEIIEIAPYFQFPGLPENLSDTNFKNLHIVKDIISNDIDFIGLEDKYIKIIEEKNIEWINKYFNFENQNVKILKEVEKKTIKDSLGVKQSVVNSKKIKL